MEDFGRSPWLCSCSAALHEYAFLTVCEYLSWKSARGYSIRVSESRHKPNPDSQPNCDPGDSSSGFQYAVMFVSRVLVVSTVALQGAERCQRISLVIAA
jgi:hypothetical protein